MAFQELEPSVRRSRAEGNEVSKELRGLCGVGERAFV